MDEYILGLHASRGFPVSVTPKAREQHLQILGATGVGKSALLTNLMFQDLISWRGFILLDPNNDLADAIIDLVPPYRVSDVIYFNPLDTLVVPFNPIPYPIPAKDKGTVADNLFACFKHIWHEYFKLPYWGSQSNRLLTNAIRLLLDKPNSTLLDLSKVFTDDQFRAKLVQNCKDHEIIRYWRAIEDQQSKERKRMFDPVYNKVEIFATNPILRDVVRRKSTFNLRHIIDNNKVLVCNLSKSMGEETASLFGSFLVTSVWLAASSRADIPEQDRVNFSFYVDEFQDFTTTSFSTILSQSRKYKLNLVIANQFLGQLPEETRQAIVANVKTLVTFRISAEDAPLMADQLDLEPRALTNLPDFHAFVRSANTDLVKTLPPPKPLGSRQAVERRTRSRHARPRL